MELAGQKIENIQDYAAVIRALKAEQTVRIAFLRGGQRKEADITPISRE